MTRSAVSLKPTQATKKLSFARVLAAFGVVIVAYEAVTWTRWLAAGPEQITQYRDTTAISWTVARGYEMLIVAVSIWLLVRVVRQCRNQRRLTVDAQLLIAGVAALFWDPFGNFFQPAFFYSSNWLNLNTWTGFAPLVVNPDASRMPQPIFIMLVYPFGLLAFAMMTNAVMRAARRRFPHWSDAKVLAAGSAAAFLGGLALEAPMFLLHLWSLPGAPSELSIFDNGHRYAAVEYLTTGMVFAGWAAVRYFKDDKGRAFTERGLGQTGSVFAMIGWCCSLLLMLQLVVNLFAFKADPYPTEFPRHLVNDMCDVGDTAGTRYGPCPGTPGFHMPVSLPGPAPFS
jgi:Spirocyclase AveC-like